MPTNFLAPISDLKELSFRLKSLDLINDLDDETQLSSRYVLACLEYLEKDSANLPKLIEIVIAWGIDPFVTRRFKILQMPVQSILFTCCSTLIRLFLNRPNDFACIKSHYLLDLYSGCFECLAQGLELKDWDEFFKRQAEFLMPRMDLELNMTTLLVLSGLKLANITKWIYSHLSKLLQLESGITHFIKIMISIELSGIDKPYFRFIYWCC